MKWGILATGRIAAKFAGTVQQLQAEGEVLAACASRSEAKAQAFAAEWSIPAAYGSYEAMMSDPNVEAVYIATPNNLHFENCRMCLNAGKHVLCEKPFVLNRTEAEALYALAAEKGLFLMEGLWTYHLPAMLRMQELLRSGAIGEIVHARSDYGFIAPGARRKRKLDSALAGGALLDIGIYNLAFLRMVMGGEAPISFSSNYQLNEFGTDDFSTVLLTYPNGKTAAVSTSIGIEMPRNAVIYGTAGRIEFKDFQNADALYLYHNGEKEPKVLSFPISYGGFEYEIREVSRCVRENCLTSEVLRPADTFAMLDQMCAIRASWGMKFTCED